MSLTIACAIGSHHRCTASHRPSNPCGCLCHARFVNIGSLVMQGTRRAAIACSKTMAKRIANALNKHIPNREGV